MKKSNVCITQGQIKKMYICILYNKYRYKTIFSLLNESNHILNQPLELEQCKLQYIRKYSCVLLCV